MLEKEALGEDELCVQVSEETLDVCSTDAEGCTKDTAGLVSVEAGLCGSEELVENDIHALEPLVETNEASDVPA